MTQAPSSPTQAPNAGLEGVVAAKSSICFIDGEAGRLVYRGYEIGDLVEHASFEETAYLLWTGRRPNRDALARLRRDLGQSVAMPDYAMTVLRALPHETPPIDAMRTVISGLGATDPDLRSNEPDADHRKAVRITSQLPTDADLRSNEPDADHRKAVRITSQ